MENIKIQELDPNTTIALDAHLLKTYSACQRKFWWLEEQHIVSKGMDGPPSFGIVMHEGIAAWREAKKNKCSSADAYDRGSNALLASYKRLMPPEYLTDVKQDDTRSPRNALRLFTGYVKHYEPMNLIYHHVEVPFAILLGTIPTATGPKDVIYTGIIDAVIEQHMRIYVNDLKTTGMNINNDFLKLFSLDQGLLGYMVAVKQTLGIDTNYAVVHAMWVAKEPKSNRGKPLDDYFHTHELYWDQEQIDEWTDNTLQKAQEIDRKKQEGGPWLMDFGQDCKAFRGCEYAPLCSSTPRARDNLIRMDYTKGFWRPLEDERMQRE